MTSALNCTPKIYCALVQIRWDASNLIEIYITIHSSWHEKIQVSCFESYHKNSILNQQKFTPIINDIRSHEVDLVRNPHVGFCRWSLGNEPRSSLSHDPTNQTSWAWRTDLLISNSSHWPKKITRNLNLKRNLIFERSVIRHPGSLTISPSEMSLNTSNNHLEQRKGNFWALKFNKPSKTNECWKLPLARQEPVQNP